MRGRKKRLKKVQTTTDLQMKQLKEERERE